MITQAGKNGEKKMATSKDLVKIVDDGGDSPIVFEKMGELKSVLNQTPNKAWIKNHPFAQGVVYLPIDKVETIAHECNCDIIITDPLAEDIEGEIRRITDLITE